MGLLRFWRPMQDGMAVIHASESKSEELSGTCVVGGSTRGQQAAQPVMEERAYLNAGERFTGCQEKIPLTSSVSLMLGLGNASS